MQSRCFVRKLTSSQSLKKLRISIIGQSQFGADVYRLLRDQKHSIVGVFTVPDVKGRPDPLALAAAEDGVQVHKFARWRKQGITLPEVYQLYRSVESELNVLPFCTQFIPMDVINHPKHQSICYHPSLLPRHRGASSINWTLINGDKKAGLSVFWADDGLDTGPLLLQRSCNVEADDTVDTLYNRFLYPEGVQAMGEAVQMVADGVAPRIPQSAEGATYEPILCKDDAKINWNVSASELHNFIRGNDRVPGAWANIGGEKLSLYGSRVWTSAIPSPSGSDVLNSSKELEVEGGSRKAVVHADGMLLFAAEGKEAVNVKFVQPENGRMILARDYGKEPKSSSNEPALKLSEIEMDIAKSVTNIFCRILNVDSAVLTDGSADFFKMGAGSMEVVRLVEEIKTYCGGVRLLTEDIYVSPTLDELIRLVVLSRRGVQNGNSTKKVCHYKAVEKSTKKGTVRFPNQIFIDNEFCNASDGGFFETINPNDESVICTIAKGTRTDVDRAVAAAERAFVGEWGRMNARDRGALMFRLADVMEKHKEELATIETIDSGAVYTLALKTHVGMSIDAFRYFAGWTDKIHGKTIPINHARPSRNLTYTRREPLGVCGIVTPWNYPLMMLAWKMSACLAAGNTVVLKPAQVTPLTSLKFGELSVLAGFPAGVINIIPGSGAVVGQSMAEHPGIRKLGFTGSTPVGKTIMATCAKSNLKKVSLELGGKSPLIVFADADMDKAVRYACSAVFFNKGENCIAAGRIFVEDSVHDRFLKKVLEEVKRMRIGDPLETSTDHGPQNHAAHLRSLLDFVRHGVNEGATLLHGGQRVKCPGLFLHPTVLIDVTDDMFVAREESFGPIMVVSRFDNGDVEGVIRRANATEYGLASGVFTRDINRALNVADRLSSGTVFVNTYNKTDVAAPFGGYKQSGFGKDLGEEALNEYLQTKAITVEY